MLRSMNEMKTYSVVSSAGKTDVVGQVYDFYFDDATWATRYMVVDLGTWLPGRKVLISPVALAQPDWGGGVSFPVNLRREEIESSPSIDTSQPVSRQDEEVLIDHYDWPAYWNDVNFYDAQAVGMNPKAYVDSRRVANKVHAQVAEKVAPERTVAAETETVPSLRSLNEVTGYYIEATDGDIGHVEELIVDTETWEIRYLVIDTKNWWPGKKVIISPKWVSTIDWDDKRVGVDLTREDIKSAPEYDSKVPVNRDYETHLFDYYGRPYYWS